MKKLTSKQIALKIITKDTCYGSFDDRTPSDDELAEYFALFIDEYAKTFHKTNSPEEEIEMPTWWNQD